MHVPMHVPAELLGQPIPQLVGFAVSQSGSPVETAHHAKRAPWGALVFFVAIDWKLRSLRLCFSKRRKSQAFWAATNGGAVAGSPAAAKPGQR